MRILVTNDDGIHCSHISVCKEKVCMALETCMDHEIWKWAEENTGYFPCFHLS